MSQASWRTEPTIEWMMSDVVARCRAALESLDTVGYHSGQLSDAAMLLRSAADDLVSLVDLVDGPTALHPLHGESRAAFGLSFGATLQPSADG